MADEYKGFHVIDAYALSPPATQAAFQEADALASRLGIYVKAFYTGQEWVARWGDNVVRGVNLISCLNAFTHFKHENSKEREQEALGAIQHALKVCRTFNRHGGWIEPRTVAGLL